MKEGTQFTKFCLNFVKWPFARENFSIHWLVKDKDPRQELQHVQVYNWTLPPEVLFLLLLSCQSLQPSRELTAAVCLKTTIPKPLDTQWEQCHIQEVTNPSTVVSKFPGCKTKNRISGKRAKILGAVVQCSGQLTRTLEY